MNQIVKIIAFFENGSASYGSGSIVGNNSILTAAHVVTGEDGSSATRVVAYAGEEGAETPFGLSLSTSIFNGWLGNYKNYNYDYAIINVDNSIGSVAGIIKIGELSKSDSFLIKDNFSAIGYSGFNTTQSLFSNNEAIALDNVLSFCSNLDAFNVQPGNSGGPVLNGNGEIIAVLSNVETLGGKIPLSVNSTIVQSSDISHLIENSKTNLIWDNYLQIYNLYETVLERDPDLTGMKYWTDKLENGKDISEIVYCFFESAEFLSKGVEIGHDDISRIFPEKTGFFIKSPDFKGITSSKAFAFFEKNFMQTEQTFSSPKFSAYDYYTKDAHSNTNDIIYGDDDDQFIFGDGGSDIFVGGGGEDIFAFKTMTSGDSLVLDYGKDDSVRLVAGGTVHLLEVTTERVVFVNEHGGTISLVGVHDASEVHFI